jgi:SAM-dependent methyltransferase
MVDRVYSAKSQDEQEAAYDEWSAQYERDLCAMGYRLPAVAAAVFARYVPADTAPILDAGCGGGLQAEPLATLGYGPITGIDLSEGMLSVARGKGIYAELHRMALGSRLDFPDDSFAAVLSTGTITPGHAPPESFEDLIRVTRPGAPIIFSLRSDAGQDPKYPETCDRLEAAGCWRHILSTTEFVPMPYSEPDIKARVHVYEVV